MMVKDHLGTFWCPPNPGQDMGCPYEKHGEKGLIHKPKGVSADPSCVLRS